MGNISTPGYAQSHLCLLSLIRIRNSPGFPRTMSLKVPTHPIQSPCVGLLGAVSLNDINKRPSSKYYPV